MDSGAHIGLSARSSSVVVDVADMAVSKDPTATIVTYALGSCIGVTAYDPELRIGGLLHFMLPKPLANDDKADTKPAMFGTTGIPLLFNSLYDLGAQKPRLIICAAGAAEVMNDGGIFTIGERNRTIMRKLFWKNSIILSAEETGGTTARTLSVDLSDGSVRVRTHGKESVLWSR